MATLGQMRTRVKLALGGKQNIDNHIDSNINAAQRQLVLEMKPQESWVQTTFSTAADTAEYTISSSIGSDVLAILMIRDNTNDYEIKRGGMSSYNRAKQDTSESGTTGKPTRWTKFGGTFVLYALIPDAVYTIEVTYLDRPTDLSSDSDTFALNDEWLRPVEKLATALTWQDLNELDKAALHMQAYKDMLINMDKPESIEDAVPEDQIIVAHNLYI